MVGDREIPRFRWVGGSGEDVEWSVDNIYLKKDQNGFKEDDSTKRRTIDWETDQVEDGRHIEKINSEEQERFANVYKPNNKGFESKEKIEKESLENQNVNNKIESSEVQNLRTEKVEKKLDNNIEEIFNFNGRKAEETEQPNVINTIQEAKKLILENENELEKMILDASNKIESSEILNEEDEMPQQKEIKQKEDENKNMEDNNNIEALPSSADRMKSIDEVDIESLEIIEPQDTPVVKSDNVLHVIKDLEEMSGFQEQEIVI